MSVNPVKTVRPEDINRDLEFLSHLHGKIIDAMNWKLQASELRDDALKRLQKEDNRDDIRAGRDLRDAHNLDRRFTHTIEEELIAIKDVIDDVEQRFNAFVMKGDAHDLI